MTTRIDPSRTGFLRTQLVSRMKKRLNILKKNIQKLIVEEDALGLSPNLAKLALPDGLAVNSRWKYLTSEAKLEAFKNWLQIQIANEILGKSGTVLDIDPLNPSILPFDTSNWLETYIRESYRKGSARSFDDVKKPWTYADQNFYAGSKQQFLQSSFGNPVSVERVRLLASRAYNDLVGITDAMSQQMSRELVDGMIQGISPRDIAYRMTKRVDDIGIRRATTLARTEIVRAHAEGQLDTLERLGVERLRVAVEWSTAQDHRVCPLCRPLHGIVITLKEARGMIPRHPNCRCAFLPANVGEGNEGQKRTRSRILRSISKSLQQEIPQGSKRTVREQRQKSSWPGATRKIGRNRPKPLF